jgi:hypothetical protein
VSALKARTAGPAIGVRRNLRDEKAVSETRFVALLGDDDDTCQCLRGAAC